MGLLQIVLLFLFLSRGLPYLYIMLRVFEVGFAALTAIQVLLHLLEWGLVLFPRAHAAQSRPRLVPVLTYEAAWYAIAICYPFCQWRKEESDEDTVSSLPTYILGFGAVHILGWLALQTDGLRVKLQAAARSATSASSVTEIVLLLAHDKRRHWKARVSKSNRSTYIMLFLFDLVETVVLFQVLWCTTAGLMMRR